MTLPSKPVVIRLTADTAKRFNDLCREFGGLQQAQVMRYVVESVLALPLPEQIEIVTEQIRKPANKSQTTKRGTERLSALNSNRHQKS